MMERKGELTTTQIVTLIILITGFAIVLILLFRLNLGNVSNKQICHNSVILQSKSLLGSELDCKTSYVCVSGGQDCEEFVPDFTTKINASNSEQLFKILADELADCWWMFGEGKVDYNPAIGGTHCGICSVIKFDPIVQEQISEIDYEEFYDYLANEPKEGTDTYLKYLYDYFTVEEVKSSMDEKVQTIFDDNPSTEDKFWVVIGINPEAGEEEAEDYMKPIIVNLNDVSSKTICEEFDLTYS